MADHRASLHASPKPRYRRGQPSGRRSADPDVPRRRGIGIGGMATVGAALAAAGVLAGYVAASPKTTGYETVSTRTQCTVVGTAPRHIHPTPGPRNGQEDTRRITSRPLEHLKRASPSTSSSAPSATPSDSPSSASPSSSATTDAPSSTPEPPSSPSASASPTTNPISGGIRQLLQQPFASTSPWNMPLGNGAAYSSDGSPLTQSLLRNSGGSYINSTAYSVPITVASSSDPVQSVAVSGPAGAPHHMPSDARIAQGTDGTMVVVDGTKAYEYWQARRDGNGRFSASYGTVVDLTGSGMRGGVRASGFSITGGLIRPDETTRIDHALVMALAGDQLRMGPVWPATLQDGDAASSYRGSVPMGSLVAIPRSIDLDSLGLSKQGLALAKALQRYGAYVGDRSAQLTLYAEPSTDTGALDRMRADLRSKLAPLLRVVTNSSADSVGGPGSRLAALPGALTGG